MNRINIIAKYVKNGTTLRITEFKQGMRGTLFDSNGKKYVVQFSMRKIGTIQYIE